MRGDGCGATEALPFLEEHLLHGFGPLRRQRRLARLRVRGMSLGVRLLSPQHRLLLLVSSPRVVALRGLGRPPALSRGVAHQPRRLRARVDASAAAAAARGRRLPPAVVEPRAATATLQRFELGELGTQVQN